MAFLQFVQFWVVTISDLFVLGAYILFVFAELIFNRVFATKPKSLKDEIILITGTANGIGRQICLQLVDSGAKLVCWDISKRENAALVDELKSMGADAYHFEVDVSDIAKIQKTAAQVTEQVGEVTMIINNAGIMPCHQFLSHNHREITRAFQVNVYGPMWILREFLPKMIEKKKGHIVTMCSVSGLLGSRNLVAYSSTKHGINGAIESLRDELRNHPNKPDIKFTTVYPSPCNTSFSSNVIHSRFPWIIPEMTEPSYVAAKTVEGIRLNKEYVYVPPVVNQLVHIIKALPTKVYWAVSDLMGIYAEPCENTNVLGQTRASRQ